MPTHLGRQLKSFDSLYPTFPYICMRLQQCVSVPARENFLLRHKFPTAPPSSSPFPL